MLKYRFPRVQILDPWAVNGQILDPWTTTGQVLDCWTGTGQVWTGLADTKLGLLGTFRTF